MVIWTHTTLHLWTLHVAVYACKQKQYRSQGNGNNTTPYIGKHIHFIHSTSSGCYVCIMSVLTCLRLASSGWTDTVVGVYLPPLSLSLIWFQNWPQLRTWLACHSPINLSHHLCDCQPANYTPLNHLCSVDCMLRTFPRMSWLFTCLACFPLLAFLSSAPLVSGRMYIGEWCLVCAGRE